MSQPTRQTIQKWGNSLAVRIPGTLAKSAHLQVGQMVEVTLEEGAIMLTPTGEPKLTLAQKLAQFDPAIHGGETLATSDVGAEIL